VIPNLVADAEPFARLADVSLSYGPKIVLQNLTMDVLKGDITCIIGLSGAGKSTILRLLNGLRKPDSGHVYHRGTDLCHLSEREITAIRRSIGFSFQFSALFDSMTIGDNVATVPRILGWDRRRTRQRVDDLLTLVGLDPARYARFARGTQAHAPSPARGPLPG